MNAQDPSRAAFRQVAMALDRVPSDHPRVTVISSARPADGKSFVAAGIAYELSTMRRRVLLVDAGLQNPVQHTIFGVAGAPGLGELVDDIGFDRAMRLVQWSACGVAVLPAGRSRDAAALCSSETLARLTAVVRALDYPVVVIDAPPVLCAAETLALCRIADETLLTVRAGVTRERDVKLALDVLRRQGTPASGVILNDHHDWLDRLNGHPRTAPSGAVERSTASEPVAAYAGESSPALELDIQRVVG